MTMQGQSTVSLTGCSFPLSTSMETTVYSGQHCPCRFQFDSFSYLSCPTSVEVQH